MKNRDVYFAVVAIIVGIFFVPTFISESLLFPFITGKNLLFRSLIAVAGILFAYFLYTKKVTLMTVRTPIHVAFAAFISVLLVADMQGANPLRSLFSNFERMEGWFTHALLFLFFVFLTQTVKSIQTWRTAIQISLIANVYAVLFAFSQYVGKIGIFQSVDRIDGTLGNATYLAGYTMMYVFLLAWLAYTTKNVVARYAYLAIAACNIFIIFVSLTRGGIVGLVSGVSVAALLIIIFEKKYLYLKHIAFGAIATVLIAGSLIAFNKDSDFVKTTPVLNRIASLSNFKSLDSRLDVWSISYDGLKEKPILGWGQDNFLYVFSKHFSPSMGEREPWFDRSHNVFFDWLIAAGVLGLCAYLALFFVPVYVMWVAHKTKDAFSVIEKAIWTGFLAAYFIFNLFVFDNIVSYIIFVFVLAYITWKGYESQNIKEVKLTTSQTNAIAFAIALTALVIFFFLVYKPWVTAKTLIQAMQYSEAALVAPTDAQAQAWSQQFIGTPYTKTTLLDLAKEKFDQATQFPLGRTEAREQLAQKLITILGNQSVSNEDKNVWVKFTLEQLSDELKRDPKNPRMHQLVGSLLLQLGQTKEAINYLDLAQVLSPKKQLIMFDRSVAYQMVGDYEKALEISKEAYELNTNFFTARARYMLALYRAGKDVEAASIEAQFIQEATQAGHESVIDKSYFDQVVGAKVDFRAREAMVAYNKGDMVTYAKFFAQIKELSPESATRLEEIIKASK